MLDVLSCSAAHKQNDCWFLSHLTTFNRDRLLKVLDAASADWRSLILLCWFQESMMAFILSRILSAPSDGRFSVCFMHL